MNKTRITFDFAGEPRESLEKLEQIVCSAHWSSGIVTVLYDTHKLFVQFVRTSVIVIDEYEYVPKNTDEVRSRKEASFKLLLGKQNDHPVLRDAEDIFADEPHKGINDYRNTFYFPNLKAYLRVDGIKPEDVIDMLASDECEKVIVFPYFPLEGKSAYYELSLRVEKKDYIDCVNAFKEQQIEKMHEAVRRASK